MGRIQPFNSSQIIKPLARTSMFLLREAKEIGENDPALAVRLAAGGLVSPIMSGVNTPGVAEWTEHTLVPVVRGGEHGVSVPLQAGLTTTTATTTSNTVWPPT